MNNKRPILIGFFLLSLLGCLHCQASQDVNKAHDFSLNNWDGKPVSMSGLRGKTVVLVFSYSYCSVSCPIITGRLSVLDNILQAPQDLFYLHVGVDPENDTQSNRKKYFGLYSINPEDDGRWMFVSGQEKELNKLWDFYGIQIEKIQAKALPEGYYIEYTPQIVIIDKDGIIRLQTDFFFSEVEMAQAIKDIL